MRPLPLLALALLPAALAGCAHDQNMTVSPTAAHRPVVTRTEHAIDLAASATGLAPGEAARLSGFLAGFGAGQGDRVRSNATGAARDAVARVVGSFGLALDTGEAVPGGGVRVVVSRATAAVGGCPDWSQSLQAPSTGAASRNYGCATNSNLAAMIADPEDLVRGRRDAGGSTADVTVKAIKSWRDANPTGTGGLKAASVGGGGQSGGSGGSEQ